MTLLLQFSSCKLSKTESPPETGLSVICTSYPELTEMPRYEPTVAELQNTMFPQKYKYYKHRCHVSLENGSIVISDKSVTTSQHILKGNYGYFVGVDLGEFGGWCKYYEYGSNEGALFAKSNCYALISVDLDKGYMISKKASAEQNGITHITKLTREKDSSEWNAELITSFVGAPLCYAYSDTDHLIYITTSSELLKIDLEGGECATLTTPSYYSYLFPQTMVMHKGKLLLGALTGVFEYDLSSDTSAFYRMEFEKYISE